MVVYYEIDTAVSGREAGKCIRKYGRWVQIKSTVIQAAELTLDMIDMKEQRRKWRSKHSQVSVLY